MLGSEGQQRDDEVRPRGQLFEQLTGPDCSAQDATNPDIDIVATHWLRFQSASTLPLNGFLDVRKNKFDGPLTCSICLTAITAVPSESFIPWKPPESDGHLYRIHVHPCFSHLYIGELWQDRPEPSRADIPTSTALISDREAFYGRPSPDVENLSFISINQEH
jgi:ribosomal protein S18 acetylase RimI-like enzyme